jgi:hypothetical protein
VEGPAVEIKTSRSEVYHIENERNERVYEYVQEKVEDLGKRSRRYPK